MVIGYVWEVCESVCNLNPCQHGGYCLHDKDSPLGYSCACNTTLFTGIEYIYRIDVSKLIFF